MRKIIIIFLFLSYFIINNSYGQFSRAAGFSGFGYMGVNHGYFSYGGFGKYQRAKYKRYYIGVGLPTMGINLSTHYVSATIDQTITTGATLANGIGYFAGSFAPLVRVSRQDAIGIDYSTSFYLYQYTVGPIYYGSDASVSDKSFIEQFSVPIAFVYKSGGEVSMSKKDKSFMTFGVGIAPTLYGSKIIGVGLSYQTRKFVMAEFGGLAGLGWKVRISYFGGNLKIMDISGDDLTNATTYKTTSSQGNMNVSVMGNDDFNISFICLPFAFLWSKR